MSRVFSIRQPVCVVRGVFEDQDKVGSIQVVGRRREGPQLQPFA